MHTPRYFVIRMNEKALKGISIEFFNFPNSIEGTNYKSLGVENPYSPLTLPSKIKIVNILNHISKRE